MEDDSAGVNAVEQSPSAIKINIEIAAIRSFMGGYSRRHVHLLR